MTDEEKIKTVAAKLMGEFYVGQRVRHHAVKDLAGVVVEVQPTYVTFESIWMTGEPLLYSYAKWGVLPL